MLLPVFTVIFSLVVSVFFIAVYIIALSFMVWMMVDAAKHDKFWWLVLNIGLPFAGSVIYYFMEKRHAYTKIEKTETHEHKE
jgi:uncharacterized membrane protein